MKKILFAAFICSQCIYLSAQSLSIGDSVPNVSLDHIYSYPGEKAHLKDFNKGCLILEFWNRHCAPCINILPFMEKMGKRYPIKLQILLVNPDSEEEIDEFFSARKAAGLYGSSLPACCSDSLLSQMFFHKTDPHFVWINAKGKVYAITGWEEMTEQNIDAFVKGAPSVMALKTDNETEYDFLKPLFINNNGGNGEEFLAHSMLTSYVPGIPWINGIIGEKKGSGIVMTNSDIRHLYQFAFDCGAYDDGRGRFSIPKYLTVMELTDTIPYCLSFDSARKPEHVYCYELRVAKPLDFQVLKSLMKEDLNRYFHLHAHMEKRKIPCWVLEAEDTILISSHGGPAKDEIDRYAVDLKNTRLSKFIMLLQHDYMAKLDYPILDETRIRAEVDIKFNADLSSPEALDKALAPYKMHFTKIDRLVDMLVLQDPLPEVE
jgi:thiol-disulfide isomerase/thioredoxin